MKLIKIIFILSGVGFSGVGFSQNTGATPCDALDLYQAAIGDCGNSCGAQLCGEYQCENAGCNNQAMAGTATVDGSCTPDNDIGQACVWLSVTATAADIVIQNETNYAGAGGSDAEDRDYTIFSGPCGALTEVGCAADIDDGSAATFTGLTIGDTYFIQVTQSQNALATCAGCTNTSSCAQSSVPFTPANDDCGNATSMTSGSPVNSTNANGTVGTDLAVCLNPASGSVENTTWYEWCAPAGWVVGDSAYVHIYNQTCNGTQGMQMSVYGSTESCATIAAGSATSEVCENPGSTSDFFFSWVANPGECFYIILDGFAGTACNFDIQVNDSAILPVKLSDFSVYRNTNIDIVWEMKSEFDNSSFELSFSENGSQFISVGNVASIGNHSTSHTYEFEDVNRRNTGGYYRLSQTDIDGTESILATSYLAGTANSAFNQMKLYPNPAKQSISLEIYHSGVDAASQLYIYAISGQEISVSSKSVRNGLNVFSYDVSGLDDGTYYLKLVSGDKVWNSKFNIQK